jgi:hypothetical protein
MYISYNILSCLPCSGLDLDHAAGRAPDSRAGQITTQRISIRLRYLLSSGAARRQLLGTTPTHAADTPMMTLTTPLN